MRIGIAVGRDELRAVGLQRGAVRWAVQSNYSSVEPLADAIVELLAPVVAKVRLRPRVYVAFGPSSTQTKRLHGLPAVTDRTILNRLAVENSRRLFVDLGTGFVASEVRVDPDGSVWGAAFDQAELDQLHDAAQRLRLRVRAVVPMVAVLAGLVDDENESGDFAWADGDTHVVILSRSKRFAGSRFLHGAGDTEPIPGIGGLAALAPLGTDGWRYAAALAAAVAGELEPIAIRPDRRGAITIAHGRRRLLSAVGALLVSGGVAIAAPGLKAVLSTRADLATMRQQSSSFSTALKTDERLQSVTSTLDQIAGFSDSRRSALLLISELAGVLPAESALLLLRLDSAGGSAVVLSPRAADVLSRLDRSRIFSSPAIVGPITREMAGPTETDRVTIEFKLAKGSPSGHSASAVAGEK